jgi:A/G-specific adenine glycosylase
VTRGWGRCRLNRDIVGWYEPRREAFVWRHRPPIPYRVLVSEVMLQQTHAARVESAYGPFIRRFPSVGHLASASTGDVVRAWSGLGYNRRAVALSLAARRIRALPGGRVPVEFEALRELPGVGAYTAAAVASIAFGAPMAAVDTNVARVVARVRLGMEPHEAGSRAVADAAAAWIDGSRSGDWNQALMDLGRDVCRRRPHCPACPLAWGCAFARAGRAPSARRVAAPPFDGSDRQLRGSVVRVLRGEAGWISLGRLSAAAAQPVERVASCVASLRSDGLISAGPAALDARPAGRVRLVTG